MKKAIKDIFEVDVQCTEKFIMIYCHTEKRHNDLPFLRERMNIEKVEKLVADLHDGTEYAMYIKNLKQAFFIE